MDKTDYITLRNENKLDEVMYNYYKEKGGTMDFEMAVKSGTLSAMNVEEVLNELDIRHSVTLMFYKEKLIKLI